MIGSGMKKFAAANSFTVKGGVAYGSYNGIRLTLEEGAGWKSVSVAAYFESEEQLERIRGWLAEENRQSEYRITGCSVTDLSVKPGSIRIAFLDNPGTMKKIVAFLPLFTEMLASHGVKSTGYCHGCGQPAEGAADVALYGNVYCLHEACAAKVEAELEEETEARKSGGSLLTGAVGAAIGAVVGIIPWVIVYCFGFFASLLGFVIGFCAKKGYELAKGKEVRAKAIIILVCVLLAVVLAELVAIVAVNMAPGFEEGFTFGEIVTIMLHWATTEGLGAVIKEIAVGWLFAVMGVWKLLSETFRQTKTGKLKKL